MTVMTAVNDDGELYAKQVLDTFEAPEAIKGYHNLILELKLLVK